MSFEDSVSSPPTGERMDCIGDTMAYGNGLGLDMLKERLKADDRHDTLMKKIHKINQKLDVCNQNFYV